MCLNCNCRIWKDSMGDDRNITLKTVAKAAIASDMDGKETLESLKDAVESIKPEEIDKEIEKLKAEGEHSNDDEHKA